MEVSEPWVDCLLEEYFNQVFTCVIKYATSYRYLYLVVIVRRSLYNEGSGSQRPRHTYKTSKLGPNYPLVMRR